MPKNKSLKSTNFRHFEILYYERTATYQQFKNFVRLNRKSKTIRFYWDLETFKYNTLAVKKTEVISRTYSFAIGFHNPDNIEETKVIVFPNYQHFHEALKDGLTVKGRLAKKPTIEIVAHNNNKFDNHFLAQEMNYFYKAKFTNAYVKQAENHHNTLSIANAKKEKENIILETRIRSMSNLEITAFIDGIKFKTIDNVQKTGASLATLGKQLVSLNIIEKDENKTNELDYDIFDIKENLTDYTATLEAIEIFKHLSESQLHYITNDIIVLAMSVLHYEDLYPSFDWNKMTKTQNIKEQYLTNDLAQYQLLKTVGEDKQRTSISYSDYSLNKENLFDLFNKFYKGGLNFYNPKFIGKLIEEYCFSIDINSSYPYVMYAFKVPTFIESYTLNTAPKFTFISLDNENFWSMYQIPKYAVNEYIISQLDSEIAQKMIHKYYFSDDEYLYLNTNTFRMLRDNFNLEIKSIPVLVEIKWLCYEFGAKDKIAEFYYIKTQGKSDNEIEFVDGSPLNIIKKPTKYTGEHFTAERTSIVKVNLNGLYGLPALRAFFNMGKRLSDNSLTVEHNAFKNKERNVAFSAFVTSQALYNLTSPFKFLTAQEIDDNFLYCDTDSLYFKKVIYNKIPSDFFHSMNLGKWDIENETINKFYILNHKKYAYETPDEKIHIRCGGVPLKNFNTNMSFKNFIRTQFSQGAQITATRSIMNVLGTITIYEAEVELQQGMDYPIFYNVKEQDNYQELLKIIRQDMSLNYESVDNYSGQAMYIETESFGSIPIKDIFPKKQPIENSSSIDWFLTNQESFKNYLKKLQFV